MIRGGPGLLELMIPTYRLSSVAATHPYCIYGVHGFTPALAALFSFYKASQSDRFAKYHKCLV